MLIGSIECTSFHRRVLISGVWYSLIRWYFISLMARFSEKFFLPVRVLCISSSHIELIELMTEWRCNFFLLQELGSFNRSFYILQLSLKKNGWVQHVKTIYTKEPLTYCYNNNSDPTLAGNYGNKLWKSILKIGKENNNTFSDRRSISYRAKIRNHMQSALYRKRPHDLLVKEERQEVRACQVFQSIFKFSKQSVN